MASILCSHCKSRHDSVAAVRSCAVSHGITAAATAQKLPPTVKSITLDVPAGRYAIDELGTTKFIVVDKPDKGRWKGYTFVNVQASDDLYPIRDRARREQILSKIAVDPKAASTAYGRLLNHCGICGRTLTDATSRAAGIGPICAGKMGW